jgi:site-specific DNA recombinase
MQENHKQNAIIYCRVSSEDQLEGTSLESQERICRDYAQRQGQTVSAVFVERGESAKTADRTELQKALAYCADKKNDIGFVIVYKLDRFSRKLEDHVGLRAQLRRGGTELVSATEQIDSSPAGRALEGILSVFAEFDNNVRTERSKQGMLERVKQGIWVWPAPYGYQRTKKGANLIPHPEHSRFVRLAFREYAKGTYTYKALAEYLSERGMRTTYGNRPSMQLVEKLLHNPVYCGVIDVWRERFRGSFPTLVSDKLFAQCQPDRRSPHASPRSANNPLFPLRGMVVCSICNQPLTGSSARGKAGKRYPYYHHHQQDCPVAVFLPKHTFEQLFVEQLDAITPDPRFLEMFKAVVLDHWKSNFQGLDRQNKAIRKEIVQLEKERSAVFDYHRRKIYTDADFNEQLRLIENQINEKRLLTVEKAQEEIDMYKVLETCLSFVSSTAQAWLKMKDDYQGRLIFQRRVFDDRIQFDGKAFGTPSLTLIYELHRDWDGTHSTLVAQIRARWNHVVEELCRWTMEERS